MVLYDDLSPSSVLATLATLSILYVVYTVTYRLFLHPLRSFPGPKLAAATFWYEVYFDVFKGPGGQFIWEIDRLHSLYGPVIRCSPEEIHVQDSEFFDVINSGPGRIRDKPIEVQTRSATPGAVDFTAPHDLHRMRRSALNPFFSKKAVMGLEGSTRAKVDRLCERIREFAERGDIVDLGRAFTALTLDVITEYCYDRCLDCIEDENLAPQWHKLLTGFDAAPTVKHFSWFFNLMQRLPQSWAPSGFKPFMDLKCSIDAQAKEVWQAERDNARVEKESQADEKAKTIFHGIMRANIPDQEKGVERLSDEASILIVAGGETTAHVAKVIVSHLLRSNDLLTRLRADLKEVVSRVGLPESRQLEDIPMMKAVIQEGLRIANPVTNRPTLVAPNEDLKCNDWVIPRGTRISMTLHNILFDPNIFPEPHKFNPDRWLEAAAQGIRLDRYLVTFSKGTRSCLGMNLAYSELYLSIAALVTRFDMELSDFDQERDLDIVRDCFGGLPSKASKGVNAKVRMRAS